MSRKRKKPGQAPNQSSTENKINLANLGAAPQDGSPNNINMDPDNKGFYENLPFHGMQNPPNKPVSVIAPFVHQNRPPAALNVSSKSLFHYPPGTFSTTPISPPNLRPVKRHQSFHGFQDRGFNYVPQAIPQHNFVDQFGNPFMHSSVSQNLPAWSVQNFQQNAHPQFIPSIFYHLPSHFYNIPGNNTIGAIQSPMSPQLSYNRVQSFGNINNANHQGHGYNQFFVRNPFAAPVAVPPPPRVLGRKETEMNIRRSASGINVSQQSMKPKVVPRQTTPTVTEKRFGSLEIKKHKCYSPTFYSMRCKKHAKKRPILYALPKKTKSQVAPETQKSNVEKRPPKSENSFQNLTDSIQILEQNPNNSGNEGPRIPKPAPRCKKRRKSDIIYENIANSLKTSSNFVNEELDDKDLDSSNNSTENTEPTVSVTEALVHEPSKTDFSKTETSAENPDNPEHTSSIAKSDLAEPNIPDAAKNLHNSTSSPLTPPKRIASRKFSSAVLISPSPIKPKTESPKGALSLQIQSKLKSPANSNKTDAKQNDDVDNFSFVPQMPILDTENKWNTNAAKSNQNAFYTLTTPHVRHLTSGLTHQYSATIPHQKHTKLIPRALFNDQQLAKSKSFSSKSKQKKHFQIPLQKCHSFRFQTAESYFQPIKNVHEENLMRNGYVSDLGPSYPDSRHARHHKKHKNKGPLVLRQHGEYPEGMHFQGNMQSCVQLQYPQPMLAAPAQNSSSKPNGVVYADLDMPSGNNKKCAQDASASSKNQKIKPKTEYATLKFNEVGQEIDV